MQLRLLLLAALPLALLIVSCGETPSSPAPPPVVLPGQGESISYSKHIVPIWRNSCGGSGCHLDGSNAEGLKMDSWNDLIAGSKFGGVIVPYTSAKSHLFQHINTDGRYGPVALPRMPLSRDPMPIEQILVIKRWIDEGAKNDAGESPMAGENRPHIFVTAQSEDKVTVIDLQTEFVSRYISVGSRPDSSTPPEAPHNILLSPDGRYFYVNLIAGGMIEKYDAHTFQKVGEVQVGHNPAQIISTRDGATLYVSNFDQVLFERFIVEVDAASMSVRRTITSDTLKAPHSLALSRDERFVYATNASGDNISEIDLSTGLITRTIQASPGLVPIGRPDYEPYHALLGPDGKKLYVTCRAKGDIRVFDLETGRVVDSLATGDRPLIFAFEPGGRYAWVPNQGSNDLAIIDIESWQIVGRVSDLKTRPHAVAFSADGKNAFITCENLNGGSHHAVEQSTEVPGLVYVVDVATLKVRRVIEVGGYAAGIVINQ